MGRTTADRHRSLSPFERFLLAQHFRDPATRAAEIARRRQARAGDTAETNPRDRFFQIFLSASQS